jgi:hypothetical protein
MIYHAPPGTPDHDAMSLLGLVGDERKETQTPPSLSTDHPEPA